MSFTNKNITARNNSFVVRVDKDAFKAFNLLCRENGTSMALQVDELADRIITDKKIPFEASKEMITAAKDTSGTENLVFHMELDTQNEFSEAASHAGISRQTLVRLYILRCADENRLLLEA